MAELEAQESSSRMAADAAILENLEGAGHIQEAMEHRAGIAAQKDLLRDIIEGKFVIKDVPDPVGENFLLFEGPANSALSSLALRSIAPTIAPDIVAYVSSLLGSLSINASVRLSAFV